MYELFHNITAFPPYYHISCMNVIIQHHVSSIILIVLQQNYYLLVQFLNSNIDREPL